MKTGGPNGPGTVQAPAAEAPSDELSAAQQQKVELSFGRYSGQHGRTETLRRLEGTDPALAEALRALGTRVG